MAAAAKLLGDEMNRLAWLSFLLVYWKLVCCTDIYCSGVCKQLHLRSFPSIIVVAMQTIFRA